VHAALALSTVPSLTMTGVTRSHKARGHAMQVGKLDANFDFSKDAARTSTDNLPGPFNETPIWLNFWLKKVKAWAKGPQGEFTVGEALAMMGSHTLMDNQVRGPLQRRACCAAGQTPACGTPGVRARARRRVSLAQGLPLACCVQQRRDAAVA
jgi:hypothetical protein